MSDVLNKQGIQSFYDVAIRNDFARKHQFRILNMDFFTNDPSSNINLNLNQIGAIGPNDLVYMVTANLPEVSFTSNKVPYAGLDFNVPGTIKFPGSDNYQIKFRLPQNHRIRTILENWMSQMFDIQTTTGNYGIPSRFSNFVAGLLDNNGNIIKTYKFVGCFAKSTGTVEYDLGDDTNNVIDFTATLAYQWFEVGDGDNGISVGVSVNVPGLGRVGGNIPVG
jgi:hypothetical protein